MSSAYDLIAEHGARNAAAFAIAEKRKRALREKFAAPGGLLAFMEYFWDVLEPDTPFLKGWALAAICLHLEAVTAGKITRLLINVPPGACKSLTCNVFFPCWEWAAKNRPGLRYLSLSFSSVNPERDNRKFRDLMVSQKFQDLYGDRFKLDKTGEELVSNDKTGSKFAAGILGTVTGTRGDRVLLDDPNSVKDEKDTVRKETARFFREGISNRLNHLTRSAIIVVQQRVHEEDVSGVILSDEMNYVHLFIPLLSEEGRRCVTPIWSDPRKREGVCFWPERYPPAAVEEARAMGEFAFAGQYQMRPEPRGGGLFKRDYWNPYSPRNGKWPACDYIVASLDPAFTAKESNDPAGFTIWGSFETEDHDRAVILLYAWRKWCVLHGPTQTRWPHETTVEFKARTMPDWGLVEHVADALVRFKVDKLLIENKASGIDVNTEMVRLYGDVCSYELIDPRGLDKWARAIRVQPIFSEGQVFAPWVYDPGDPDDEGDWRKWAATVIDEMASFPTGKWDDITDSVTQALWWMRQHGFLTRRSEKAADLLRAAKDYKTPGPLYPV